MRQNEASNVDRIWQCVRKGLFLFLAVFVVAFVPRAALSAPYAALVMDARSGEVLHASNADTRLHPASLTKMMTLYIAFEAIENGEISADTMVTISKKAASEPPSKLGLKAGQKIRLRYLIRAAAIKSANDAATAIGEAIEGSEAAFARRMNRTAKALGMSRTTFKNANGLTEDGHLSTARDMTILGRHVFYDYPDYYNLFSRVTADAGGKTVYHTNRAFLNSYKGADGIKTGYTRAAGFNLTASAERGSERILVTVFGGRSTASRNAKVAELMDLGFRRAPSKVAVRKPSKPNYQGKAGEAADGLYAGKTLRVNMQLSKVIMPKARPVTEEAPKPDESLLIAAKDGIQDAIKAATEIAKAEEAAAEEENITLEVAAVPADMPTPEARPEVVAEAATPETAPAPDAKMPAEVIIAEVNAGPAPAIPAPRPVAQPVVLASLQTEPASDTELEVVTRMSSSGGRHWGINVGLFGTSYEAERKLLQTALKELGTLDDALRKVSKTSRGFNANFVGMTEDEAAMACRRLAARGEDCSTFGPS